MVIYEHEGTEDNKVFEFVEQAGQCEDCKKEFTPHKWTAQVQLRQKSVYNKGLARLE